MGSNPVTTSLSPGSGGDGGPISVTTSSDSSIAIANTAGSGTVNGITALSAGNYSGIYYNRGEDQAIWGYAGAGGSISVTHEGTISDSTTLTSPFSNSGNLIGIALASVGGSSYWPSDQIIAPPPLRGLVFHPTPAMEALSAPPWRRVLRSP